MPANLPPQYYELERQFRAEKDAAEKLRMAQELLAMMPKHKGTDKLQAEMKAKISQLKKDVAGGGAKKGGGPARLEQADHVEREGAGQVALIGPPNTGKSSIITSVTHARPLVADFPYTTREVTPGMMRYETIRIQLIDTPPISPEQFETYLLGIIRNADMVCLVAGVDEDDCDGKLQFVIDKLKERRVILTNQPHDPEAIENVGLAFKRTILVAHKMYEDGWEARVEKLRARYPDFPIVTTSILDDASMEAFKKAIFDGLHIIRVFTKQIGHEADFDDPIILKPGATVEQAALHLHKDFAFKLQFAKIWGEGKFPGQRVQKTFVLSDGDIVEFHI